jgi:poly-gamma-glutamate capsule biosynthesis protein CapA/YwtB (metallophosphatase superfamily)
VEVHGIDLLAQVEALLRDVAEYQRQASRVAGRLNEPASESARRTATLELQKSVTNLKDHAKGLYESLEEIEGAVATLDRVLRSGQSA